MIVYLTLTALLHYLHYLHHQIWLSRVHRQPTPTEEATRLAAAAAADNTWNRAPGTTEDAGRHHRE